MFEALLGTMLALASTSFLVTDLHQRTRGLPRLVVDVGGHGPAQEGRAQVDRDAGEPADRGEVRLPRIDFVFFIRVDSSSV